MNESRDKRQLKQHQNIMNEMLQEIDRICRKNHIKYMLFAGTALGAVRHKGFVPWDDDLDIVMQRTEYERFMKIAPKEMDTEKYYLQQEFSEHWPMFFSKLRKNNTACIERYIPKDEKVHQGIYIDIFPCDNLSDARWKRWIQFVISKMVIAQSLDKRGYLTDNRLKKIMLVLSRYLPQRTMLRIVQDRKDKDSKMVHTFFAAASKYEKNVFPREWFEQTREIEFEGKQYPISKYYDEMLTKIYGDYMTPLAESEREYKIHAELVDFENSYEKYTGIQKKMKFENYTRSIR